MGMCHYGTSCTVIIQACRNAMLCSGRVRRGYAARDFPPIIHIMTHDNTACMELNQLEFTLIAVTQLES